MTGFVRELLNHELQARKMAEAARRYAEFLESSPEEQAWLSDWEAADLDKPLARRRRK